MHDESVADIWILEIQKEIQIDNRCQVTVSMFLILIHM